MHRGRTPVAGLVAVLIVICVLSIMPSRALAGGLTFEVDSTLDSFNPADGSCDSPCTLRDAVTEANAEPGLDTITFDPATFPPDNPATIQPVLVAITSDDPAGLTIDGTGAGVLLNGGLLPAAGDILFFLSGAGVDLSNVTVRGLSIENSPRWGIKVCGGAGAQCDDDVFTTLVEDVAVTGSGDNGIYVEGENIFNVTVTDSIANDSGGDGIELNGSTSLINPTVQRVTTNDNDFQGVYLNSLDNLSGVRVIGLSAARNHFQGIDVNSLGILDDAVVSGGSYLGNGGDGIRVNASGANSDLTEVTVSNLTANGNGLRGVRIRSSGFAANLTVSDITVNENDEEGVQAEIDEDITGTIFEFVSAARNGLTGIDVLSNNSSVSGVVVRDCTSSNNNDRGLTVYGDTGNVDTLIDNCTVSGNGNLGVNIWTAGALTNARVENTTANDNTFHGINLNSTGGNNTNAAVVGSIANGNGIAGININSSANTDGAVVFGSVANNNMSDGILVRASGVGDNVSPVVAGSIAAGNSERGIAFEAQGSIINPEATSNTVLANAGAGIDTSDAQGGEVHFNRIVGNNPGVLNNAMEVVDAENNWWGCNAGPFGVGCDTTAGFVGVDSNPWLVLELSVIPDTIPQGATSTLVASVTRNSDDVDTSALGNIQDRTEILFETDLGDVGSKQVVVDTVGGEATATLTANEGPGIAKVSAMLDNQTVESQVTIVEGPTPSASPTATPTAGPTETPVATPGPTPIPGGLVWGDHNCSGEADPIDGLLTLRHDAGLGVDTGECPELSAAVPASGPSLVWGDVDCNGAINPVDALKLLRYDAGLEVDQEEGCPEIGEPL